ncbi:MAG: GNAT family N-acetyltransferase [Lachnospiraceae bacterium]|nr:GNAT family N-acetyltransferase [Lachnospiraceae bacterium]
MTVKGKTENKTGGPDIIIRDVKPDDAAQLLGIYRYYIEETAITFETSVPAVPEFRARIEKTLARYPYICAERDGKIEGYAYAGAFVGRAAYDKSVETTIYVEHGAAKNGLGRRLYAALEERLAAMGIVNLYACIGYPAEKEDEYLTYNSAEFHEHMGYRKAGEFLKCGHKFGRWYSMIWMEKLIGEHGEL